MYYRAQIKKMPDMIQVCTPHSEPYSEVRMISVLKGFLTYKQFFLDGSNIEFPCRNSGENQLQFEFLTG